MTERQFYDMLIMIELALSPLIAYLLLRVSAPYGRHFRDNWGPKLNFKVGWFIMEAAALVSFDITFFQGERFNNTVSLIFFALWQIHYFDRAVIQPFQMTSSDKQMPIAILISGVLFNTSNGYLNARFLSAFGPVYTLDWLLDGRFIGGMILFVGGFLINRYADRILLNLRKDGEKGYKIPYGMFFNYVSCPNYLGEIIQWCGWALATWSLPGLTFAIFTAANLVPRAYTHHCWYRKNFPNYPSNRKAIIPFVF
jgi:3-oxo-5-alpha-steroid 4-dehydrogenase 1